MATLWKRGHVDGIKIRKCINSWENYRFKFETTSSTSVGLFNESLIKEKINKWMKSYEDFIGLTEMKETQLKVIQAEEKFMETQEKRREKQQFIQQIQLKLKDIHNELNKTSRGEDNYLNLITQEHAIIREEKGLLEEFKNLEKAEREYFSALSLAVRSSHEKERAQAERTKYWSIIGSICGAVIGIIGTSINNRMRMKELRGLVSEASDQNKLHLLVNDLTNVMKTQHRQIVDFVSDLKKSLILQGNLHEVKGKINNSSMLTDVELPYEKLETQTDEILSLIQKQEKMMAQEMKEVKVLVNSLRASKPEIDNKSDDIPAIYVGNDVERLLKDAEKNLEFKMKINSLATVAFIYGAFAITLPIIFQYFKGP
ncbi:mitochondrial potassium channel-like [Centruroides vittatus]|uniref:mitochondrial potassium channel-like n=1 Tax=Centruroides vittatus TaxID=120091 RepID=UPI003510B459